MKDEDGWLHRAKGRIDGKEGGKGGGKGKEGWKGDSVGLGRMGNSVVVRKM